MVNTKTSVLLFTCLRRTGGTSESLANFENFAWTPGKMRIRHAVRLNDALREALEDSDVPIFMREALRRILSKHDYPNTDSTINGTSG